MRTPIAVTRRRLLQGTILASLASILGLPRVAHLVAARRRPAVSAVGRAPRAVTMAARGRIQSRLPAPAGARSPAARLPAAGRPRARGERYGGWETETIAGHSLGHYLSACSLMHAQTGDAECRARAHYIVAELGACQRAQAGRLCRRVHAPERGDGRDRAGPARHGGDRPRRHPLRTLLPERLLGTLLQLAQAVRRACSTQRRIAGAPNRSSSPKRSPRYIERALAGLDCGADAGRTRHRVRRHERGARRAVGAQRRVRAG